MGAVTIAPTWRDGTDIQLGGNLELRKKETKNLETEVQNYQKEKNQVMDAGGLFVIGTERHESRRIDNQLRGRSGRQGDKGNQYFF